MNLASRKIFESEASESKDKRNADPLSGPTGVETAGELGFEYGKNKEITLVNPFSLFFPQKLP